jgi:hypothetical protein
MNHGVQVFDTFDHVWVLLKKTTSVKAIALTLDPPRLYNIRFLKDARDQQDDMNREGHRARAHPRVRAWSI